jgi:hypothetical protein
MLERIDFTGIQDKVITDGNSRERLSKEIRRGTWEKLQK